MLLALDTATATASVAVYDLVQQQLLAELTWQARRRQTQDLLGSVQELLRLAGLTPAQLTALAVTTGPGSFTGVRIAISAAKGIGLGLPASPQAIGVPTLSITAAPWLMAAATRRPAAVVCAFLQAGRGRYNWCWFRSSDLLRRPVVDDHSGGDTAEFASALGQAAAQSIWLVGEVDGNLQAAVAGLAHVLLIDGVSAGRRAGQLARLAALHLANGNSDNLKTLQPLYLRNP